MLRRIIDSLILPLQLPDAYMVFRANQNDKAIHWLLASSTPGTQVSVTSESGLVNDKLEEVLDRKTTLAEQFGKEDTEDTEDCFWEITLVSADNC